MSDILKSDATILKELGEKFKTARINSGYSQEELAEHSGLSRTTITRLERGENISVLHLIRLLREVGEIEAFGRLMEDVMLDPRIALEKEQKKRQRVR